MDLSVNSPCSSASKSIKDKACSELKESISNLLSEEVTFRLDETFVVIKAVFCSLTTQSSRGPEN